MVLARRDASATLRGETLELLNHLGISAWLTDPEGRVDDCNGAATFLRTLDGGQLEPDIFHTKPQYSKTRAFEEVVRLLPRRIAFYGAAACGARAARR